MGKNRGEIHFFGGGGHGPSALHNLPSVIIFLLTARPWAERGSWFTRAFFFLTARPWAERGSRFTLDLFLFFLTARPWAERGS